LRVILYTGKGGVGKTSLSAATALASASAGHQTLVMSTDAAHSLSDSLGVSIGNDPVSVAENLFAEEVSVNAELKANWGKIQEYFTEFLRSQGYEDYVAEEMAIFPGMEELFSLLKLKEHEDAGKYDVAVVDCAPTGSTLKLLSFTDVFQWYMQRFFNLERKVVRTIKPIAEKIIKAPLPADDVYENVERLYHRLLAIKEMLTDPEKTSIRIVCNPEKMVIQESQRAYTYLNLFGYPVDLVINNRVLPPEAGGPYFDRWIKAQKKYIRDVKKAFAPLPILQGRLFDGEMVGIASLRKMAGEIFGDRDPSDIFYKDVPVEISQADGAYTMSIKLPHTAREDIDLWVKEGEVIITVHDYQRNIVIPRALMDYKLNKARFEGGKFRMEFTKE